MRAPFDPYGAASPAIDQQLGDAFQVVRFVARHIPEIASVAYHMEALYTLASAGGKANADLLGLPPQATDLGEMEGTLIPDGASVYAALQIIVTFVENLKTQTDSLLSDMGQFTGTTIPDQVNLHTALQALETAIERVFTEAPVLSTEEQAEEGTDNTTVMSPLRVAQSIESRYDFLLNRENQQGTQDIDTVTGLSDALAAKAPNLFTSTEVVGGAPAYIETLGEKAGEVISLVELAGKPDGNDYTTWFGTKLVNYPFKRILLPKGQIILNGPVVDGTSSIVLEGHGPTQTTLFNPSATGHVLELEDCHHILFKNMGFQHNPAVATAGCGLYAGGVGGRIFVEHVYAANNPDGHLHFIGTGDGFSGVSLYDVEGVDSSGPAVKMFNCHDWLIARTHVGRVGGGFGYAEAGFWIEESNQGAFWGGNQAWDNVNAVYGKNSSGCQWGSDGDRFEESQQENIVLDGCSYGACTPRTHTPSKGSSGTYSAVHLKNGTTMIKVSVPEIYSWNSTDYKMKSGVEIDAGCNHNVISGVIVDPNHCTSTPFSGVGATNDANYFSDCFPRVAADYDCRECYASAVPEGYSYITPQGTKSTLGTGGVMPGKTKILEEVLVAVGTPPTGTYTYQVYVNGTAVGLPFTIASGAGTTTSGYLGVSVDALALISVQVAVPGGSGVTDHRAAVILR